MPETETNATRWTCEKCGGSAVVRYAADASVYDVVELLRESHRAASPSCPTDLRSIRVTEVPTGAGEGEDPTNRAHVSGVSDPYAKRLPDSLVQHPTTDRAWRRDRDVHP